MLAQMLAETLSGCGNRVEKFSQRQLGFALAGWLGKCESHAFSRSPPSRASVHSNHGNVLCGHVLSRRYCNRGDCPDEWTSASHPGTLSAAIANRILFVLLLVGLAHSLCGATGARLSVIRM